MVINEFWVLLLCIKSKKFGIRLETNICQNSQGTYYNQEEWLEVFLGDTSAFCNGSESDDSDNVDEDYNENIAEVVRRCCLKKVFLKILQISQENTCVGISF